MRWGLGVVLGSLLLCAAPASADVSGAVGGVRDPAAGVLQLWVQATESDGLGLRTARASLAGQPLDLGHFGDPECDPAAEDPEARCPAVGGVELTVPTTAVADGPRRLEVTVEDGGGTVAHVLDRAITVANTPIPWQSSVTIGIGSGPTPPGPTDPGGGGGGGGDPDPPRGDKRCRAPRLSAFLDQRPLRFRRGVPLLLAGRKYRFEGRLTCRIDGRRRSAPRGTAVLLRQLARGRTRSRSTLRVRSRGRFVTRLTFRRSCTLVFQVRGAGGGVERVRIPIRVVRGRP